MLVWWTRSLLTMLRLYHNTLWGTFFRSHRSENRSISKSGRAMFFFYLWKFWCEVRIAAPAASLSLAVSLDNRVLGTLSAGQAISAGLFVNTQLSRTRSIEDIATYFTTKIAFSPFHNSWFLSEMFISY